MLALRYRALVGSLVFLAVLACDEPQPLEPFPLAASGATRGASVKAPSNAAALAVNHIRIDVSWQWNSATEDGFEVHRSTTGESGAFALRASTGPGTNNLTDWGLTPSMKYCYKVRAYRTTGARALYSDFSNTTCATTLPPPVPAEPSGTDARPENSTTVEVRWIDNSTDEDGFRIERSLDLGSSWTTAGTVARNVTSFVDVGRTSELPVCYRVVAFNAWVSSAQSNTDCTAPPAAPTNLIATEGLLLTWTDNSAIEDAYVVWAFSLDWWDPGTPGSEYRLIAELPPNSTSVITGCSWDCHFYVGARKDAGFSDWAQVAVSIDF